MRSFASLRMTSPLEREPVARFFGIDPAAAPAAAGIEGKVICDPRAGAEGAVTRHELRQVMAGLGPIGKAREGHVGAELASLDLDAAIARHGRDLLLQPQQPDAAFDRGVACARRRASA